MLDKLVLFVVLDVGVVQPSIPQFDLTNFS